MNRIESTGKTIEEAISAGLAKLGCSISDVTLEILEEGSKGLFGLFGSRQAKVRLTLNDDDAEMSGSDILASVSLESEKQPARKEEAQKAPPIKAEPRQEAPKQVKVEKPAPVKPAPKPERPAQPERKAQEPIPVAKPQTLKPLPTQEQYDASTPMGCAQAFLAEVTRLMGVQVVIEARRDEEGHLFVDMTGDTLGILIGRRGETLDALQYLTSLQVNRLSEDYIRVTLDTENYRAKREEALQRFAIRTASRVVKTGRKVVLEAMNPYERRILHAALQNHEAVTTHSEGDEPNRHVVVTLKRNGEKPVAKQGDKAQKEETAKAPAAADAEVQEAQDSPVSPEMMEIFDKEQEEE